MESKADEGWEVIKGLMWSNAWPQMSNEVSKNSNGISSDII